MITDYYQMTKAFKKRTAQKTDLNVSVSNSARSKPDESKWEDLRNVKRLLDATIILNAPVRW